MNSPSRFIYVHDPMCSWCWAHRPVWMRFEAELNELITVEYRVGGLAPDSDVAMPQEQQQAVSGYWRKIQELLGSEFNFDFWTENTPRRSTYPACRAVIAARWQDAEHDMITALQKAYYLRALNPSDTSIHLQLAEELGLNVEQFEQDLGSEKLQAEFSQEIEFSRSLPIEGFPSMILIHNERTHEILLDYKDYSGALAQVKEILAS